MKNYKGNEENVQKLMSLERKISEVELELQKIRMNLEKHRFEFEKTSMKLETIKNVARKPYHLIRSLGAYMLGRRNIKRLYSRTYKSKNAENVLRPYKYNLYNLGFIDRTLKDLHHLLESTHDRYLKRQIAWELALWYAGQYTKEDAKKSLAYLQIAIKGERRLDQLRKIALLSAECYDLIGELERGKQVLQQTLLYTKHPDLYFAYANLETNVERKLKWINKTFTAYQLQPITFATRQGKVTYGDLRTKRIERTIEHGPKVSIILPAYNFSSGIHIAIESILKQTWRNIELIIVDDCSTDETVEVAKQYMKLDERIKLLSTKQNSGPYVARNIGLQQATGEFVTVNDADDWSHAEKIEIQVSHLLNNPDVIANTSEHARLTDKLKFYRRGTMETYIFSNMSSLMFRRKPVMQQIGYWDSVRFAADGEFKRRLIKTFGQNRVIDLKTGPLSLPRQSDQSLTGDSAFGYQGFFMGARKEYIESIEHFYEQTASLFYPFPQKERPFPVPEPMWPVREKKLRGARHFDVVIACSDQRDHESIFSVNQKVNIHKHLRIKTGIVQLSCYNMVGKKELQKYIRKVIDGQEVQMLVYGEKITCDVLIIMHPYTLLDDQKYIPYVQPKMVVVIIDELPKQKQSRYVIRDSARQVARYFGKRGKWFAYNQEIYEKLIQDYAHEIRYIQLSKELWHEQKAHPHMKYEERLKNWLIL